MRFASTFKILGALLMMFSLSMLPPIGVELYYHDGTIQPFLMSFLITLLTGGVLTWMTKSTQQELKTRDGFLVVVLFWTVLSLFGSIPFVMDPAHPLAFNNAFFESVSGLTTTGASVLFDLQKLPHSILYYRQQLTFLGGMGIIVLAVAILPMLGVGGMQLCRAETAGPIKNTKLKPRIKETAKALWMIYVGLTLICALAYWVSGMQLFDAIGESFATVSTGGFSMHDNSFAYYHSDVIDVIAIIFMLLGATNFALHFQCFHQRKLSVYPRDPEFRAYLAMLVIVIIVTGSALLMAYPHAPVGHTLLETIFTVVSLSSSTGAVVADFNQWPTFLPYLLMIIAIVGGCAASTAGGLKMIRMMVIREQGMRELRRLIHPRAVLAIKVGEQVISEAVMQAVWGFMSVFLALFSVLFLILLGLGLDFETAFGALSACLSNTGTGIGRVYINFASIPSSCKWVLTFAMLAGRLEIFSLLVLFMPSYWRR